MFEKKPKTFGTSLYNEFRKEQAKLRKDAHNPRFGGRGRGKTGSKRKQTPAVKKTPGPVPLRPSGGMGGSQCNKSLGRRTPSRSCSSWTQCSSWGSCWKWCCGARYRGFTGKYKFHTGSPTSQKERHNVSQVCSSKTEQGQTGRTSPQEIQIPAGNKILDGDTQIPEEHRVANPKGTICQNRPWNLYG